MNSKYSDPTLGNTTSFINLPVQEFNKITWRGGDDKLAMLLDSDPGQYLGEFRSMVKTTGTAERPSVTFPQLPWPVVTRRSGRESYQRYSTCEMLWRPITSRSRFVKYSRNAAGERVKNDKNRYIITATSLEFPGKGSGFDPQKEVFGIVMNDKGEQVSFGLLELDTWNTYISYNAAAKKFEGVSMPDGQIPVYRIGTRGEVIKGEVFPKSKQFNGRSSVEIEALDLDKVMPFEVSEYFDTMWQISQAWAKCPRWNASGGMVAEAVQDIVVPDPTEEEIPY